MSVERKYLSNEYYDAGLITLGAVSLVSRKVIKDGLGIPSTANGVMKLVEAVGLSSMGVHYLQVKKFLPDDPFKPSVMVYGKQPPRFTEGRKPGNK